MVRTQIQLTKSMAQRIKRLARQHKVSVAEAIRRAVDKILQVDDIPDVEELKRRAISVIGTFQEDVTVGSSRHDDYLAEAFQE